MLILLTCILARFTLSSVNIVPLPQSFHEKISNDDFYYVTGFNTFPITQKYAPISELSETIIRYQEIFFQNKGEIFEITSCPAKSKCISSISINVIDVSHVNPSLDMKEDYTITVNGEILNLECSEVFGCYHGLETISQSLSVVAYDNVNSVEMVFVFENYFPIKDFPRFKHRGMMIDSSRHFLPVWKIKQIIDGLEWNKLNVLHWHIVDAQSFPLYVESFPNLSKEGSYDNINAVYSHSDLKEVQEYARKRGIRIILEIDIPGHSSSWKGYNILANCPKEEWPILNPIRDLTYEVIEGIIKEMISIFPERYFHFGGDEVKLNCWKEDKDIEKWMRDHFYIDHKRLVGYFDKKVHEIYSKYNITMICWEECLLGDSWFEHYTLPKDTIVQVWKTKDHWLHLFETIVEKKYKAILSGGFYLNLYRTEDWKTYYLNEPFERFNYTEEQRSRLIGLSACLWGEHVDPINWDTQAYPGILLYSERAWSNEKVKNVDDAAKRVDFYRCELVRRGVRAMTLQPGYCYWANINK